MAVAGAAPAYAVSEPPAPFALSVSTDGLARVRAKVTFGAAALPLSAGMGVLTYARQSGTGYVYAMLSVPEGWTRSAGAAVVQLVPPAHPALYLEHDILVSGPSTWLVTLTTPDGVISHTVELGAATAARSHGPIAVDPSREIVITP